MSPWTDTDTDTAATRRAAIQVVLDESRRVLAELRDALDVRDGIPLDDIPLDHDSVAAGLHRLLANVERPSLPRSWHLGRDPRPGDVPDLTTAPWPGVCQERTAMAIQTDDYATWLWHEYTCTRRAGHTGRHAAGGSDYIVAVWEQDEPEVLGPVEGAA